MADAMTLIDQALDIGRQELELLQAGEVDRAADMARDRERLMNMAYGDKDSDELVKLESKLWQLASLQGRLTTEAKRLHAEIKQELLRTRQESARLSGYGKAVKPTPLFSRFLSKRG